MCYDRKMDNPVWFHAAARLAKQEEPQEAVGHIIATAW